MSSVQYGINFGKNRINKNVVDYQEQVNKEHIVVTAILSD